MRVQKQKPSFTVGPIMFTSDLLWQYSVFPTFTVHMLCSCWWHIQKPCKSLWCWCWEWNYGKNVPRCAWADCSWLFVLVLVWGLPNSGALVMEEHWASGLMKYPGDPASEGLEFITHVPSLHSLTLWSSAGSRSPMERNTAQKPNRVSRGSLLSSVSATRDSWK